MIRAALLALALEGIALSMPARGSGGALPSTPPPKVVRVAGPCQGGNRPSVGCKTCEHCAYCSPKRHPGGVCAACPKKAESGERRPER